ncbi:MAG: AbrB/MazE/SpoVT family DNA-binding domain-containing protein [Acidobacteria bacterium]|nr:AbrB/MazE/SpoVT family DNA-binding domain-containing protein [Acidobacteriota bacterium]
MGRPRTRVTEENQSSIPTEIRDKYGIVPGSVLEWEDDGEKVVVCKTGKYTSEDIHRALFKTPPKPRTLKELKEGIEKYLREKHARRCRAPNVGPALQPAP